MRISDWSADVCSSDLAGHERGFDLQQVAADLGPGQPRDQADLVVLLGTAEVEALHAQVLLEVLRGHAQRARLLLACSRGHRRSEEHTSELPSLMRISYAVVCLKKKMHSENEIGT